MRKRLGLLLWLSLCHIPIPCVYSFQHSTFTANTKLRRSTLATFKVFSKPVFETEERVESNLNKSADGDVRKDLPVLNQRQNRSAYAVGVLVLSTVPVVWGSYVPVVRLLYEINPPIPGFVFSAAYYFVASASMSILLSLQTGEEARYSDTSEETKSPDSLGNEQSSTTLLSTIAGVELGTYLFLGNLLQVIGLKTVPADRAGFLVQSTTILVPIVQGLLLTNFLSIPLRTWVACVLALFGFAVMGYDGQSVAETISPSSISLPAFHKGDVLILCAAVLYSLHVVRLGRWANETSPLELVARKTTTELVLSLVMLTVLTGVGSLGAEQSLPSNVLTDFVVGLSTELSTFVDTLTVQIQSGTLDPSFLPKALAAVFWTGLVSTAYTTYAQSFGQRLVRPVDANLIYSMQPLFTALFAYALLDETMGVFGFAGGALVAGAVYVAISPTTSIERYTATPLENTKNNDIQSLS